MNNAVFGKTIENVRKIQILNLLQQKEPKVSEPNFFTENSLAIEMKKN